MSTKHILGRIDIQTLGWFFILPTMNLKVFSLDIGRTQDNVFVEYCEMGHEVAFGITFVYLYYVVSGDKAITLGTAKVAFPLSVMHPLLISF